jgi:hypothetical protein
VVASQASLALKPDGNLGPAPLINTQRVLAGSTIIVDTTIVLEGRIDPALLFDAARAVCRRHEALRTTVDVPQGVQIVHQYSPSAVAVECVPAGAAGMLETVNELARREWDPARLPVFRCVVVTETPQRCAVYLAAPHAVSDQSSLHVIARDFLAVLSASLTGQQPTLPPLRAQFGDYLRWREQLLADPRTWTAGGIGQRAVQFWAGKLAGAAPPRFGHPRAVADTLDRMTFVHDQIDPEITGELLQVCQQSRSSLFHAVLAASEEAVALQTGTEDVTTMCMVHGRGRSELRDAVGLFTEDVAFRHRVRADTRRDYLTAVARDVMVTYAYQDIPLAALAPRCAEVARLYAQRRFRGMFLQFLPSPIGAGLGTDLPGLTARFPSGVGALSAFALPGIALLSVDAVGDDADGGLEVELMYDRRCWPSAAMNQLVDGFADSVRAFAQRPDQALG